MAEYFTVDNNEYGRLLSWFSFFNPDDARLEDRILAEKFYQSQWSQNREPGQDGHSLQLNPKDATCVRLWFDYVLDPVADNSDFDYSERLDEFLAKHA